MLKESVIEQIKKSNRIKGLICITMNRSMRQVENWLVNDSPMLLHDDVLNILASELKKRRKDLMVEKVTA